MKKLKSKKGKMTMGEVVALTANECLTEERMLLFLPEGRYVRVDRFHQDWGYGLMIQMPDKVELGWVAWGRHIKPIGGEGWSDPAVLCQSQEAAEVRIAKHRMEQVTDELRERS